MRKKILKKIVQNNLTPQEGYNILYGTVGKKGRFVIARIRLSGHPFLNTFINGLFLFPFPLGIVKLIMRFIRNSEFKEYRDLILDLIPFAQGVAISIVSKEAIIKIKII
ncbi:MAG: hypothetical protein M0R05_05425 [Bacilli bacterium]|nr:hypothetical protein [Bacilli bacterium]MDD4077003.1 hypothetical protein [Bacilli bacterium]MDD4387948.1 hypothetical protein [Bacilli bacterium]